MQFGMPTLIENRTFEENAALCAELGLSFIELNMNFPDYQLGFLERTDELLAAADRFGIYFTVHLDENLAVADFNPLVAEAWLETVRRTAAAAKKTTAAKTSAVKKTSGAKTMELTAAEKKLVELYRAADAETAGFATRDATLEESMVHLEKEAEA